MKRWCRVAALMMAMIVSAASCNAAWADGDPASDVLLSQLSFLPADAGFSSAGGARLEGLLSSAARAGYPVRVAIIPNSYDLGSITVLWRKPETYARFLGAELSLVYKHPLIVVMPNGVGLNWPGHSTADAQRQLTGLTVTPGPTGLLDGAVSALRRLLSSRHVRLAQAGQTAVTGASPPPHNADRQGRSAAGDGRWIIIAVAFAALLAGAALVHRRLWHGWRGRRRPARRSAAAHRQAAQHRQRGCDGRRWRPWVSCSRSVYPSRPCGWSAEARPALGPRRRRLGPCSGCRRDASVPRSSPCATRTAIRSRWARSEGETCSSPSSIPYAGTCARWRRTC